MVIFIFLDLINSRKMERIKIEDSNFQLQLCGKKESLLLEQNNIYLNVDWFMWGGTCRVYVGGGHVELVIFL